jgi:DNA-binding transcriptional ArsR family regulator
LTTVIHTAHGLAVSGDIDDLEDELDAVFQALADPRRRAILRLVAVAPRTVTELGRHVDASMAGVSKHLRVLRDARLVAVRRDQRTHKYRFERGALDTATATLEDVRARAAGRRDPVEVFLEPHEPPLPPARPRKRRRRA